MNKKRDQFSGNSKTTGSASTRFMSKDDQLELDIIALDHCYSKSWNSQSDLSHAETAKYLLWLKDLSTSKQQ